MFLSRLSCDMPLKIKGRAGLNAHHYTVFVPLRQYSAHEHRPPRAKLAGGVRFTNITLSLLLVLVQFKPLIIWHIST